MKTHLDLLSFSCSLHLIYTIVIIVSFQIN